MKRGSWWQIAAIGAAIVLTTALHLATPVDSIFLHEIYQRLYYVPIIAAALLFGWRGGLSAAAFASVVYLPHIWMHWQDSHYEYSVNQYAEMILFHVIGGLVGLLGDKQRRAQQSAEQAADELRRTFEQLLQAERLTSLGELASGVVHEVRNPLAAIKGAVEIVGDELAPDSPRREFAAIAKREIERLNRIVEDFLNFARPAQPVAAQIDANELARAVLPLIEQRAAVQQVKIVEEFAPAPTIVSADAGQIKQILLNLALNALQAMPEGGALTLRVKTSGVIEVEDTGGGIAPALAARIFDPFFTTKDKGTGLGLSIAYKIAQQNGGQLSFENGAAGARFRLMLARE
jgi:signal transduction histidine kinase